MVSGPAFDVTAQGKVLQVFHKLLLQQCVFVGHCLATQSLHPGQQNHQGVGEAHVPLSPVEELSSSLRLGQLLTESLP